MEDTDRTAMNDQIADNAVRARRRRLLLNTIEIALGELAHTEGVTATRGIILRFARQLKWY